MYHRNHFCVTAMRPTALTIGALSINHLSLNISWLKCLMLKAPFVGFVGAVGSQKSFLWYIDEPWYPI